MQDHNNSNNHSTNHNNTTNRNMHIYMVVPYTKRLSESFCGMVGIQICFQGGNTIKDLLVAPKDTDNTTEKSKVVYKCDQLDCDEEYIGWSSHQCGQLLHSG